MDEKEGDAVSDLERGILVPEPDSHSPGATSATKQTRSTAYLDGLRGLAAFLVYIAHHMSWMYGADDVVQYGYGHNGEHMFTALPFVRVFFTGGSPAVAIFFVLSGYVLTRSPLGMLRNSDARPLYSRLALSAVRRPFRLFIPVIAVSLSLAVWMHFPFGLAPRLEWPTPKDTLFAELWNYIVELAHALNPFVKHGIREQWFPYDPPVWTIALEFTGSMLVFTLVALLTVVPPRWRGSFLIGLSLVFLVLLYDWAMALFIVGVLFAMSDVEGVGDVPRLRLSEKARSLVYNALFFIGWFLLCQTVYPGKIETSTETPGWGWLTGMVPPAYYKDEYWRFWNAIGAIMVVLATLRLRWLQNFFSLPLLRYLGRVSFSFYLIHIPLIWTAVDCIYRLFGNVRTSSGFETWFDNRLAIQDIGPHGLSTRFLVIQLFALPFNLIIAEWCTRLLDEPSVKVGRWIEAKITGKA